LLLYWYLDRSDKWPNQWGWEKKDYSDLLCKDIHEKSMGLGKERLQ
jgi:hypothetical protein